MTLAFILRLFVVLALFSRDTSFAFEMPRYASGYFLRTVQTEWGCGLLLSSLVVPFAAALPFYLLYGSCMSYENLTNRGWRYQSSRNKATC
jgi:hypothetical protein